MAPGRPLGSRRCSGLSGFCVFRPALWAASASACRTQHALGIAAMNGVVSLWCSGFRSQHATSWGLAVL